MTLSLCSHLELIPLITEMVFISESLQIPSVPDGFVSTLIIKCMLYLSIDINWIKLTIGRVKPLLDLHSCTDYVPVMLKLKWSQIRLGLWTPSLDSEVVLTFIRLGGQLGQGLGLGLRPGLDKIFNCSYFIMHSAKIPTPW